MFYKTKPYLNTIAYKISGLNEMQALHAVAENFTKIVFNTSFVWEDQVLTHLILTNHLPIEIFTIDTGRLFDETYYTWNVTNKKYNTTIKAFYPQQSHLENYVAVNGVNAFYDSSDLRKQCCYIRKTEPLQRALAGKEVLISSLRYEHLKHKDLPAVVWDEANEIITYFPLLNWSLDDVKNFIYDHNIPFHPLHNKGFASIGCAPCSRAIKPGEHYKNAHWWWETGNKSKAELSLLSF